MNALALAGLARLIFALSEPSLPPPPPTPSATSQEQQKISRNEDPQPSPSNAVSEATSSAINQSTPSPTAQASKTTSGENGKESSFDYTALAVAVFTGILTWVAWLQLQAMKEQGRFMELTKRAYEIGERARLWISDLSFDTTSDPKFIVVKFAINNTGRTAADVYEQTNTLTDTIGNEGQPWPANPPYEGVGKPAHLTISAGRKIGVELQFKKVDFPELVAIQQGKQAICLIGYMKYRDAFGVAREARYAERHIGTETTTIFEIPGYNIDE